MNWSSMRQSKVLMSRVAACSVIAAVLFAGAAQTASQAHYQHGLKRGPAPGGAEQATFSIHRLGTDHAEGLTTLDMNGDGRPDILSGAYWYENPGPQGGEWKRQQYRQADVLAEFVSDCGEWTVDVNHDGRPDVVTAGWMTNGIFWWENPGKLGAEWKRHFITDSIETEGGWMADINGDGKADVIFGHYGHMGVLWIDFAGAEPKVHHVGGRAEDGHGIGVADIDGDGKADILTPNGWFKQTNADTDQWVWHGDWKMEDAGFPIIGYDVNNDGRLDVIFGQGHSYGLYWLEQQAPGGSSGWVKHTIDESFSQVHALRMADIDGDGEPELIAGKRYRGHNGDDPGSYDPLVVYYYKVDRKTGTFTRYPISINGTAGAGTQFLVEDLDGDGDLDIATAGKTGVHFFENLRVDNVPKAQREKEILLEKNWPFPGEGPEVKWERGPKQ
jgi:hypothetical protein